MLGQKKKVNTQPREVCNSDLPECCDFTTLPSGALQRPIQPSFGGNLKSSSPKLNFNSAFQILRVKSYRQTDISKTKWKIIL